jgi:hypothetical protein
MMTSTILRQAQARLTPDRWGKGTGRDNFWLGAHECPHLAISAVARNHIEEQAAVLLFMRVATGCGDAYRLSPLWFWNDHPSRTWQDVQDAFSAAIAIAEQQETPDLEHAEVLG